jgi:NADH:ubiquinone oxidoreductase subunit F (NADH-binding)
MVRERKILTERVGRYDATDPAAYEGLGGFAGLRRALEVEPAAVIDEVRRAGLTGRGGAGFPTALKWQSAADRPGPRCLICNADEGEMGTRKDRVLLEGDPWAVVEGMLIAARAIGAEELWIYIRGEYEAACRLWEEGIARADLSDLLGAALPTIRVARGRGLYIAGEELALIASLAMERPMSRLKPPYPTEQGLFGRPTVVQNVETLANLPFILARGAETFRDVGEAPDFGTRLVSLSGDVKRPGVYELEAGTATLGSLIEKCGGGTLSGRPVKAVQPGGGTSALLGPEALACRITSGAVREAGSSLGTAAVIVYEEGRDAVEMATAVLDYYGAESCGRCLPCRLGLPRLKAAVERVAGGEGSPALLAQLRQTGELMTKAALCGFGQTVAQPILSALRLFPAEFEACRTAPGEPATAR